MGVYEKYPGTGVWYILWYENGKRMRQKVGTSKQAAINTLKRKLGGAPEPEAPKRKKGGEVLVSDLIDLALAYTIDHKDRRSYLSKAAIVRKDLGDRVAKDLTPQDIDKWLRLRSGATANRYKSFLSLCYREGIANGKVTTNPARLVRQRRESSGRTRYLLPEEFQKLMLHVPEEHRPAVQLAVSTGMRMSEQFTLDWSQVNLERRVIELDNTKNGSSRTVHLNDDAIAALHAMKTKVDGPVFPNRNLSNYGTRAWFGPALQAAGIEGISWHNLRHTFCSYLALAGAGMKDIQELAGHKTLAVSGRYMHLSPDHKGAIVNRISLPSVGLKSAEGL